MQPEGESRTLEVRWIHPGRVPDAMIGWLGPFADQIERREDRYLVDPSNPDLGVKIKGAVQLDLKAFRGSPGELVVPGGGRGRLEIWEKWTFPLDEHGHPPADSSGWLTLQKRRRRRSFRLVDERAVERPVSEADLPGCTVELTEVAIGEETWWSLGIEAGGRSETLDAALHATAASLFQGPSPRGIRLDLRDSMSYARWLGTRSGDRFTADQ
ncbi:MAG: hypothetical protein ACXVEI_13775 [Actinomycetota bacterium]